MDFPSYRPPFIDISIGFPMDFPWISMLDDRSTPEAPHTLRQERCSSEGAQLVDGETEPRPGDPWRSRTGDLWQGSDR